MHVGVRFHRMVCLDAASWRGRRTPCRYARRCSRRYSPIPASRHRRPTSAPRRFGLDQANGRLFPEIELNADIGAAEDRPPGGYRPRNNDIWRSRRQAGIQIRQVLFDGWERANDIYRSQANISAASYRVLVRSEAVGLSSVEAYIDVVRHNDLLALAQDNVRRHQALQRSSGTLRRREVADRRSRTDHRTRRGGQGAGRPDHGRPGRRACQVQEFGRHHSHGKLRPFPTRGESRRGLRK